MFKKLMMSGALAGVAVGLLSALLQLWFVVPLLMEGELFELGERVHFADGVPQSPKGAPDLWAEPARHIGTLTMNLVTYAGFGLVLAALYAIATRNGRRVDAKTGVIWGLCGFLAVQLAPAFSLPPELPGTPSVALEARQLWWFLCVAASVLGIGLIAFARNWGFVIGGGIALLLPHVIGAPHLDGYFGVAPPELATLFGTRVLGIGAISWALLGGLSGYFWAREA